MASACLPMLLRGGHCDKKVHFGVPLYKRSLYLLPGASQSSALIARSGAAVPDCTGPLNSLLTVTLNPVSLPLSVCLAESGQRRWVMAHLQRGAVPYSVAPCTDSGYNGGVTHGYWSGQMSRRLWVRGLILPIGSCSVRNANGRRFLTVIKCILCFYLKE